MRQNLRALFLCALCIFAASTSMAQSSRDALRLFGVDIATGKRAQMAAAIEDVGAKFDHTADNAQVYDLSELQMFGFNRLSVTYHDEGIVKAVYASARPGKSLTDSLASVDERTAIRKTLYERYGPPDSSTGARSYADPHFDGTAAWGFRNGTKLIFMATYHGVVTLTYLNPRLEIQMESDRARTQQREALSNERGSRNLF